MLRKCLATSRHSNKLAPHARTETCIQFRVSSINEFMNIHGYHRNVTRQNNIGINVTEKSNGTTNCIYATKPKTGIEC